MEFDSSHRKVSPGRESVGSDLFTVLRYDPIQQTVDLQPATINQRGTLKEVPIAQSFGGSWEFQQSHQPTLAGGVNQQQWGNCARGARWGSAFPITPGDLCRVMYAGESQSDPVVTEFYRAPGNYGIPWVANQVLSAETDYTKNTPVDDDEPEGRYDLLLPSGAWLRSSQSGSWVVATAPVDRPKAFITLDANGTIKIKSRGKEGDYKIHLEFDPEKEEGRIVVGTLEGGSHIEFKDGNITIKAQKNIQIQGQRVDGDIKPQKTPAMDQLTESKPQAGAHVTTEQVKDLATKAAGEMVLNGALTPEPSKPGVVVVKPQKKDLIGNLIANPSIDASLRGKIGDVLQDPQGLVDHAIAGFTNGMNQIAMGDQFTKLLGANALSGNLSDITSKLDLGNLAKDLGIPSWVADTLKGGIPDVSSLLEQAPQLLGMGDNELLSTVMKQAGAIAMGGANAIDTKSLLDGAIAALPTELKNRVQGLVEEIDTTPVGTPKTEKGETDWMNTAAQRLGAHILRGNTMLGGSANLFDLSQLEGKVDPATLETATKTAGQLEEYFANPHALIDTVSSDLLPHLESLAGLPPEIKDLFKGLSPEALGKFPEMLKTVLGSTMVDVGKIDQALATFDLSNVAGIIGGVVNVDSAHQGISGLPPEFSYLSTLLANLPKSLQDALKLLPPELFKSLGGLNPADALKLLDNPASFLKGLDPDLIRTTFGEGFTKGAGVFDMKVSKIAKFNTVPKSPEVLKGMNLAEEFHLQTFSYPIERVVSYGKIDMPDYWAEGGIGNG